MQTFLIVLYENTMGILFLIYSKIYITNHFLFSSTYRALVASSVAAPHISKIVASLTSALSSLYDPQRVVVAAFFAEVRYICLFWLKLQLVAIISFLLRSENTLSVLMICLNFKY